jgi:hypothetical protein
MVQTVTIDTKLLCSLSSTPTLLQTPSSNRYEKRYELSDFSSFRNGSQIRFITHKTTRGCMFR